MFNTVAVGLIINAQDRASRVIDQVGRAFDRMKEKGKQLKRGLQQLQQGLQTFAMAGAAVAAGLGFMASRAANFEQQMSAVRSVMQGASQEDMTALEQEIKRLGATTSKSATEAAQGAEMLARAGFTAQQSIAALGGVIAAAEADSMDLQSATNVVANGVRAFGLEASQATRVADVLALTSARTNTNISQLGEGLRYTAPIANQLGQSIESTSMSLGLLANMGLQGSVGGTALKNMMLKLSTASDETNAKLTQLGISTRDANGDMVPMHQIIEDLAGALPQLGGNMEQTAFLSEVFGLRGMAAAGNLATSFNSMQEQVTDANGNLVTQFEALRNEMENAGGTAQRMSAERLNNLKGAFTLLGSAIEGVSIEAFTGVLGAFTPMIKSAAEAISRMAEGMQNLDAIINGEYNPTMDETNLLNEQTTSTWLEIGAGIKQAFDQMGRMIGKIGEVKEALFGAFGGGDSAANMTMGKMAAWGTVIFAVLGTVFGAVLMLAVPFVIAGKAVMAGLAAIASALMWPLAIFGVFLLVVQSTRKEGQSFGDRMIEMFAGLRQVWTNFATGFMSVYQTHIAPSFEAFKAAVQNLFDALAPAFNAILGLFGDVGSESGNMGATVGVFLSGMIDGFTSLVNVLAFVIGFVVDNFVTPFVNGIRNIVQGFQGLLNNTRSFPDALWQILQGVFDVLMNTVLRPFKTVILGVLEAMKYVGAISEARYNSIAAVLNGTNRAPRPPANRAQANVQGAATAAVTRAVTANTRTNVEGNRAPTVNVPQQETRVTGCVDSQLNVNGRRMAAATAESQFELTQRAGANMNPWQQGAIMNGGLPAGTR